MKTKYFTAEDSAIFNRLNRDGSFYPWLANHDADRFDGAIMAQAQDNLLTCWFEQYDSDTGRFVQTIDIRR